MNSILMTLFFSFSVIAGPKHREVVYGEDHRQDPFESTDPVLVEYARATAAKVPNIFIRMMASEAVLRGTTLQDRGICAQERFSHQNTTSTCSGFLVSETLLVTAGHCIRSEADCKINRWVFDYRVESSEQVEVRVPRESVYSCKRIVTRAYGDSEDYAVIELNRPVKDRRPLSIRRSGTADVGAPLVSIGYPSGLPVKIATGATVRELRENYLVSNLDTFQGNSGSAVINLLTGEVEGILVRGETDYVVDPVLGCKVVNVCRDDGCQGESVQLIRELVEIIPEM